jgi:outer membrane receptor for ferrienterochelin and colicin
MKKILHTLIISLFALTSFAQKGQIRGQIIDASNNNPIPFANVIIEGTQIGATSDLDGNFTITGITPGYIKLRASFVGYKTTLSADILVNNSNIPFIEVLLEPTSTALQEVIIAVDPFEKREEAPLSMQSIGVKEIESNPGSNRDISRVIQSFPGVGSTPAFRNDVIIRGGGPSENRFFLDGVEIPVLNHFSTQGASGGPVGIINADFIQKVDFYSGSFPASKYNALSGVLDFKLKEGNKDRANLQFAVGASEAAFTLDGPVGQKSSYIFSVRRSYLQFLFSAIGLPFLPTFNDYQLKWKTNFDSKNQLTIISLGSLDRLKLNDGIENPDPSQEYILGQIPVNNQWSYTIGAVYKNFFDNGFHSFIASRNMLDNQFYKYPDNDETQDRSFDYNSQEIENKFRYELSYRKFDTKFLAGINYEYAKYNNSTSQLIFANGLLNRFTYSSDLQLNKFGASFQATKRVLKEKLLITAGLRVDGNTYNSEMSNPLNQFSPRVAFSYSLTSKTKINAGTGRYYQLPAYTTLGYRENDLLINKDAANYIGADHFSAGIEHRFNEKIMASIEGFYKDYFQYPIDINSGASLANQGADYSSVAGAAPVTFNGTGRATGFEVLNRINFQDLSVLATYTYVRSLFTDINNELIPSSWDSQHLITITGTKDFKNNWRMGLKWRFVGGLPYTPYDLATSSNIQAWNAIGQAYLDFDKLNDSRFEPFHQLDIRIDKNFFFDRWTLMVYADIQNAYNFKSKGRDYIIRSKDANGNFLTNSAGSEYILERIGNESGTLLPTIGIMVKL